MTMRGLTISVFVAVGIVTVALYLAGRAHKLGLVPLGEVVDALRSSLPGRLALSLGWAWLGWHLLAR
jgi:Family of unknown function (DUF6186)